MIGMTEERDLTMNELTMMADSLLRWAVAAPEVAPLAVSAARDILCLAEAELRLSAMTRTASADQTARTLPQMFDRIRNTNRDCSDIRQTISKMETANERPGKDLAREVGIRAVDRLMELANSADAVRHPVLASAVDELILAVTSP
jgi:hypothetical protein